MTTTRPFIGSSYERNISRPALLAVRAEQAADICTHRFPDYCESECFPAPDLTGMTINDCPDW